jgi:hypothetical protein
MHESQQVHDVVSRHISYDATWYHPHYLATRSYSTSVPCQDLLKLCRPGWGLTGVTQSLSSLHAALHAPSIATNHPTHTH